jgi:predicted secreted protein
MAGSYPHRRHDWYRCCTLVRVRRIAIVLLAVGTLAVGCSGPAVRTVAVTDKAASLRVGEVLRVDIGEVNPSVGDSWFVVSGADGTILGEGERDYASDCAAGEAGCGGRLAWEFPAVHAGETDLVLRYCYRSKLSDCKGSPGGDPSQPVTIHVMVS